MTTRMLFRWSGLALLITGVLTPLAQIIHPAEESPHTILTQTWRLVTGHILMTAAILLGMLGLVGLYVYQAERSGKLGLTGFTLAFSGNLLLAVSGNYGYIAPVLAARAPDLLNAVNQYPPELWLDVLMVLTYMIGFLLLGIATYRARRFPRLAGILLAIAPVLFFIFSGISIGTSMTGFYWIAILGQLLFGMGLILCGLQLWRGEELENKVLAAVP